MNIAEPLVQASLVGEAIDNGPMFVVVVDDDMNYVAVNRYAAEVLGYTREELLSMKVTDVTAGPGTCRIFAEFLADPQQEGVAELVRKDGTRLTVGYSARKTTVAGMPLYVSVGVVGDYRDAGTTATA